MNTTEWLQARVKDLEADIKTLSESIKYTEGQVSYWTKLKEAKQQELDDNIKIKRHLSLIIDRILLAENL